MKPTKVLIVFGTRPEAIKMAPIILGLQRERSGIETRICVTAQHREMLDPVLNFFGVIPDYDLNLMKRGQDLYSLTAAVVIGLKPVLEEFHPEYVLVHGDTTTSAAAALAAYYAGSKVVHIEAGLRTYNRLSPFPEEMNRQLTGRLADIHFAPTAAARQNLLSEGIADHTIHVVGNTVIDALLLARARLTSYMDADITQLEGMIDPARKIILVTGHRRENVGDGFAAVCRALRRLSERGDVQIIYPVHLNPKVREPVFELLNDVPRISLIAPLAYPAFIWLMNKCHLILTDSGGIQEEAPSIGKPVLVMRNVTERPEAVETGSVKLVGTDEEVIVQETSILLDDPVTYARMSMCYNPYGKGDSAKQIITCLFAES